MMELMEFIICLIFGFMFLNLLIKNRFEIERILILNKFIDARMTMEEKDRAMRLIDELERIEG
jgi:hypothetical protein